jgi:hypothetical protein
MNQNILSASQKILSASLGYQTNPDELKSRWMNPNIRLDTKRIQMNQIYEL